MTQIRAVAIVVDTTQLTIYHEDGLITSIPQGDPRVRLIIDKHLPTVNAGQVAVIDLDENPEDNPYRDFEEKSGGGIKIFRVAKRWVASIFGGGRKASLEQEEIEAELELTEDMINREGEAPEPQNMEHAIEDIMANAEPVTKEGYTSKDTTDEHTMIAVVPPSVNSPAETKPRILPGVEMLKGQFAHAAKLGSTQGVENLIRRLTAVIDKRAHSVEDVLRFLERGDLPVADDGTIIAYKVLKRAGINETFVDCHTRKVHQRIGSYVCVDEALVDKNRRNECSNGLHIARRAYIAGFSGDVCTMTKIAPEDIITVPHGDPNKVRVCGYHIIFLLPEEDYRQLKNNQPVQGSQTKRMLAAAIKGDHIGIIERVEIRGQHGNDVHITPIGGKAPQLVKEQAVALDDASMAPGPVSPKEVAKSVEPAKQAEAPAPVSDKPLSRSERARQLYDLFKTSTDPVQKRDAAQQLMQLKKTSKVGWPSLGITQAELHMLTSFLENQVDPKQVAKTVEAPAPVVPAVEEVLATKKTDVTPAKVNSRQQKAQDLFNTAANQGIYLPDRRKALADLRELQKKSKIGWDRLGLVQSDIQLLINSLALDPENRPDPNAHLRKTAEAGKRVAQAKAPEKTETHAESAAFLLKAAGSTAPTKAEIARDFFKRKEWSALYMHKKTSKKSWETLGFNHMEVDEILKRKP